MSTDGSSFTRAALAWTVVAVSAGAAVCAQDDRPLPGPATAQEIAQLVKALGHPSYEARTFATRRLCAIGPQASDDLRAAAAGADAEVAIRAKQLLTVFDQLLFAGTEVSVAFSKSRIEWKQSVDLIITITNNSKHPSRVPFDVDPAVRAAATADARQVTDMLDVADWLKLRAPDGRDLELRMDDLAGDPAVSEAVQGRAAGAMGDVVPPGEKVTIVLRDFNRGWARYPLLHRGDYSAMLDYTPDWTDDVLRQAQAARVASNAARLEIVDGAPPTVVRGGGPSAEIVVEADGEGFVARFLNRADKAVLVNANFGSAAPFADGRWIFAADGDRREVAATTKPASTWNDFEASRLLEAGAGEFVVLGRIALRDVEKAVPADAARSAAAWTISFSYSNLCDRIWQARPDSMLLGNKDAPAILREPLPRQLLGTRLTSNHVPLANGR